MSAVAQALLSSWTLPTGFACGLAAYALVYVRGWHRLRMPRARLYATASGLGALTLAIASPIDALAGFLLTAHMVQHLLLLAIAPPLLLLGSPARALWAGLPSTLARQWLGPWVASTGLLHLQRTLARPLVTTALLIAATSAWHAPFAYQLALRSLPLHQLEHACFFGAALNFWSPVVHARGPRWSLLPCLLLVDMQNTALSALLVFSDHVLYPVYAAAPRLFDLSARDDQTVAGVIMWVPGSFVFLGAAVTLCVRWLSPQTSSPPRATVLPARRPPRRFDLLRAPFIGGLLRARHGRRLLQSLCLMLAVAVVVDGLRGPRVAAMNLAGVVPWTFWRGLTVVALLAAGNLFCMACPFTLPRALAKRLGWATRSWPRALRGKWLSAALLAGFFVAQERLGWWDAPRATALLVVAYFVAAFVVDALVRDAGFCKYVCPVGQFQFVGSLISPLEVKVRLPVVCASCVTKDCIRGNEHDQGCQLDLYLPRKAGNLDCTFCLDCVKACPHDNIGILAVAPGRTLLDGARAAALGPLARRLDVALLAVIVVLAAFALAGIMVTAPARGRLVAVGLIVAAVALTAAAVKLPRERFCRLVLALVPLGMGMWAAHLSFHLLSGWRALWPVVQRLFGVAAPDWSLACAGVAGDGLVTVELLLLDAGFVLSLYVGWRVAGSLPRYVPFALFAAALWTVGALTLLQPMQMRGMLS